MLRFHVKIYKGLSLIWSSENLYMSVWWSYLRLFFCQSLRTWHFIIFNCFTLFGLDETLQLFQSNGIFSGNLKLSQSYRFYLEILAAAGEFNTENFSFSRSDKVTSEILCCNIIYSDLWFFVLIRYSSIWESWIVSPD